MDFEGGNGGAGEDLGKWVGTERIKGRGKGENNEIHLWWVKSLCDEVTS